MAAMCETQFLSLCPSLLQVGGWGQLYPLLRAGDRQIDSCVHHPESGSLGPRPTSPPHCTLSHGACPLPPGTRHLQALTGPLRADDLCSRDNLRLTFEAGASWRLFLSHSLAGQLDTAVRQTVLPGEQPHSGRFLKGEQ